MFHALAAATRRQELANAIPNPDPQLVSLAGFFHVCLVVAQGQISGEKRPRRNIGILDGPCTVDFIVKLDTALS